MEKPAQGTPLLEKITGGIGAVLLLGVCLALVWDAWRSDDHPPGFAFAVDQILPSAGRHLVRFRVQNTGARAAETITVRARLMADPVEEAELELDFLAAGEEREAALLFTADPRAHRLELSTVSFSDP
jgi:uncharacterized protein (TIGR02588 family)